MSTLRPPKRKLCVSNDARRLLRRGIEDEDSWDHLSVVCFNVPEEWGAGQLPRTLSVWDATAGARQLPQVLVQPAPSRSAASENAYGGYCVTDEGRQRRLVYVSALSSAVTFRGQLIHALDGVADALSNQGFSPASISRTWFYISNIWDNYQQLNDLRNTYFDKLGIQRPPASTAVGAALEEGRHVACCVEAVSGPAVRTKVSGSSRQMDPEAYGPRFSRSKLVEVAGNRTLHVSGISHIGEAGQSLGFLHDKEALVKYVLSSFIDLLHADAFGVGDLESIRSYCRDPDLQPVVEEALKGRGIKARALVATVPICRRDLEFEIEGVATQHA